MFEALTGLKDQDKAQILGLIVEIHSKAIQGQDFNIEEESLRLTEGLREPFVDAFLEHIDKNILL